MAWKRLGRAFLFPHIAVMIILLPISVFFLVYSMVYLGTESALAILSYLLSAYTLTVWCFRLPYLIRLFGRIRKENKYALMWQNDTRLRVKLSLYGGFIWNGAYALLQLCMGIWHKSYWFGSLACYYLSLALMRFYLVCHTKKHKPGEMMAAELKKYRSCGVAFLVMNLFISLMVFFMVYWNRSFEHHEITTIALAAYTFTSLTLSIVSTVRYRKYQSPVYSASKAISLASATVSVLTLESTMLTTFGKKTLTLGQRRIFLGLSGGVICVFIILMAVYMIRRSNKKIRLAKAGEK